MFSNRNFNQMIKKPGKMWIRAKENHWGEGGGGGGGEREIALLEVMCLPFSIS